MALRRATWAAVTAALCLFVTGASAQGQQRFGPGRGGADAPRRMMPVEQRSGPAAQRDAESRDGDLRERGPRLSPEERRQLRRDVHDAGRDLYPGRMSRRRREAGRE